MHALALLVSIISGLNRLVGNVVSWLALAIVAVCFTVVVQRYVFSQTQLWMQDLYIWLNGAMFTSVAGFALLRDDHVRVDIFYRPGSLRWKAIADIVGTVLFLLPFMTLVLIYATPYVERSWRLLEASQNPGGMPGLFVLKSFIIVFAVLVGLQGIAMLCRAILVLGGKEHFLAPRDRYRVSEMEPET